MKLTPSKVRTWNSVHVLWKAGDNFSMAIMGQIGIIYFLTYTCRERHNIIYAALVSKRFNINLIVKKYMKTQRLSCKNNYSGLFKHSVVRKDKGWSLTRDHLTL